MFVLLIYLFMYLLCARYLVLRRKSSQARDPPSGASNINCIRLIAATPPPLEAKAQQGLVFEPLRREF